MIVGREGGRPQSPVESVGGRPTGWVKQLILTVREGASMDLMTWPAPAVRAYPAIAEALGGHYFTFDAKEVTPAVP